MASWQAHLTVAVLKLRVKRRMRAGTKLEHARATLNAITHKVPPGLRQTADTLSGVPGEWLRPAASHPAATLLYLHGGGYFACSPATHRPITGGFARRGFEVFAADYRLAPEHPFPAAINDAVAAYRGLLARGIPPERITIAGDSAGGGLALATLLSLRDAGDPAPAAAALFSPWTDLAGTGDSLRANARRDAMFRGEGIGEAAAPYLAGADPRTPLASPLYADLAGLPPLLIHVGSYEVLLDDSRRLAERAREAGTRVSLRSWPVLPHVWPLFRMPESAEALDEAAAFLREAVGEAEKLAA